VGGIVAGRWPRCPRDNDMGQTSHTRGVVSADDNRLQYA
jgi:hypothetical protein